MEEWYENLYYHTGIFVTSPGHPVGMIVRKFNSLHTLLMLPNGEVVRRPILWCDVLRPPEDPLIRIQMYDRVFVNRGRLQGMYGKVIGSHNGRVFIRTLPGSLPLNRQAIKDVEWNFFVEDAACLSLWQILITPEEAYPNGFLVKLQSRGL